MSGVNSGVRTQFLAAETANALFIFDRQVVVLNFHDLRWAGFDADAAAFTAHMVDFRTSGQAATQRFFEKARQAEVNVSVLSRTK